MFQTVGCANTPIVTGIYLYNATGAIISENTIANLKAGNLGDFVNGSSLYCAPGDANGIMLMGYDNQIGIDASEPSVVFKNDISNVVGGSHGISYSTYSAQQNSAGDGKGIYAWNIYVDITYLPLIFIYYYYYFFLFYLLVYYF